MRTIIRTLVTVTVACLTLMDLAAAAETQAPVRKFTDIPAQELDSALVTLEKERDLEVIFVAEDVRDVRTRGATGQLTSEEILRRLLAGTGLTYRFMDEKTITILPARPLSTSKDNSPPAEQGMTERKGFQSRLRLAQNEPGQQTPRASGNPDEPRAEEVLQEVTVTAQRRAERLQDVPISVQVVGAEELARGNHNSLEELTQTVPGVHVSSAGYANRIFIRGIGSGENPSFDQSAATFVDDIYHGRSKLSNAVFLDVERIEFLKGPQSTFFGNNAIAGALNIVTRKPGPDFDAWARALYGEFGQYAFEGAVGGPLTGTFGARLAVTRNGVSEGWIDNVSTGETVPRINNRAGRLTFAFHPNERFDATLKLEAAHHILSGTYLDQPPQWTNCPPPAPIQANYGSCNQALAMGAPIGLDSDQTTGLSGQFKELSTSEGVLTLNYDLSGYVLTSVSGYHDFDSDAAYANLVPAYDLTFTVPESYHQFSQELRIASPAGGRVEYLAGAYFQTDRLNWNSGANAPMLNYLATFPGLGFLTPYLPLATQSGFAQDEDVYSVFGSVGWNVTDRLKLNAGLRGSWVKKEMAGSSAFGTGTETYGGFVPLPQNLVPIVEALFGTSTGSGAPLSQSDRDWMPSAGIQYQLTPDAMAYLTYSRGFKAGGFNGLDPLNSAQNIEYGPEHVDAYELGLKSLWLDGRLRLNVDVFRSDYKGLQVLAVTFNPALNINSLFVRNAADSVSQGVELEGQWAVSRDLRLTANVTYLDAHYENYPNASPSTLQSSCASNYVAPYCSKFPQPVPAVRDASGQDTDYAPRWSGSVTASYTAGLGGDYRLTTGLSPYFSSRYNQDPDGLPGGTSGYLRLDGAMTLESPDGRWSVDLIGKNLTDRVIATSSSIGNGTKVQPRNFALQFRYSW